MDLAELQSIIAEATAIALASVPPILAESASYRERVRREVAVAVLARLRPRLEPVPEQRPPSPPG